MSKLILSLATVAVAGTLCACSSLSGDLQAANAAQKCAGGSLIQQTDCQDTIVRPIWQRDDPGTVDLYVQWAEKAHMAAVRYDVGLSSLDGYKMAMAAANADFSSQITQRRQAAQANDDNTAAWALLGATAFLDGYNSARTTPTPVINTSCTTFGRTTNCLSQ